MIFFLKTNPEKINDDGVEKNYLLIHCAYAFELWFMALSVWAIVDYACEGGGLIGVGQGVGKTLAIFFF